MSIKNIWINTKDGSTNALRRYFVFHEIPLIQIKKKSLLKVNSITVDGAAHNEATGHNWTVKAHALAYNLACYYNTDKEAMPTIACFNFDAKQTIQNGFFSLELEPQDLVSLEIEVFKEDGGGLLKNHVIINLYINLTIQEIEEDKMST
jgi:hypothetical protein